MFQTEIIFQFYFIYLFIYVGWEFFDIKMYNVQNKEHN